MSVGLANRSVAFVEVNSADPVEVSSWDDLEYDLQFMLDTLASGALDESDWRHVIELLQSHHERYFDERTGPDGAAWAKNAPLTVKLKGHGRQLEEEGLLRDSLAGQNEYSVRRVMSPIELDFGTCREWSAINQAGTGRIPARPHVGASESLINDLVELVASLLISKMFRT